MDDEEIIFNEFKNELTFEEAINRLLSLGYTNEEAEDLAWEWAEGIENASTI